MSRNWKKISDMFKFLREDTQVSSMRVTLFLCTLSVCALILSVCTYMLLHAYRCTAVDWSGMSIFVGAISAFTATLLYGKVQQKKVEATATKNSANSGAQ